MPPIASETRSTDTTTHATSRVTCAPYGTLPDGTRVDEYTLANVHGMTVRFLTLGGIITEIRVPDRDGAFADVALGYASLDDYLRDPHYHGAIVGRYANRIANARFTLDGVEHRLQPNGGAHSLHGGMRGFNRLVWSARSFVRPGVVGAELTATSPDGDEGFPGTLVVRVMYRLTDANELIVDYDAETDRATPVNLTQHLYVNLAGHDAGDVLSHELQSRASQFTPIDETLIPTGELCSVAGTPFDFAQATPLGARLGADDEQLRRAGGYDHNLVLGRSSNGPAHAATLHDPGSGRTLDIYTNEPGLQIYPGNHFGVGPLGKSATPYLPHAGIAIEPQHFPDSPNQPHFPSTILRPGNRYHSRSIYQFSAR